MEVTAVVDRPVGLEADEHSITILYRTAQRIVDTAVLSAREQRTLALLP